jgi:hypothetical protein
MKLFTASPSAELVVVEGGQHFLSIKSEGGWGSPDSVCGKAAWEHDVLICILKYDHPRPHPDFSSRGNTPDSSTGKHEGYDKDEETGRNQ